MITLRLMNTLENSEGMKKTLMQIAEDGVIDESEKDQFKVILEYFDKLRSTINELVLIGDKCKNK